MLTGSIETWAGEITEIGAIYPFIGSEVVLVVIGVVLWVLWFVMQARMEDQEYREEMKQSGDSPEE